MVRFLDKVQWYQLVEQRRVLDFTEQEAVVEAIARSFSLTPIYLACVKKEKPMVTLLAFTSGDEVKIPIHFFYASLWFDEQLSDTAYCNYLGELINALKNHYRKIAFNLPVTVKDIRPFLWAGFDVQNRFTYLRSLDSLTYGKDVEVNIRQAAFNDCDFRQEVLTQKSLAINLQILRDLGNIPKRKISEIENLITALAKTSHLMCFNAYVNQQLVASHILFIDEAKKVAYTVLKNKVENGQGSLHSVLYHHLFTALQAKEYAHVDLLGADMENIAAFKSRFNGMLHPHFMVSYSKRKALWKSRKANLTDAVKRIVAKFI